MIRSMAGRMVASVAAVALAAGAGVAAGSGTAGAVYIPHLPVTQTVENIIVDRADDSVPYGIGATRGVPVGQTITFTTSFSAGEGDEHRISRITDHGPAGFAYVSGSAELQYRDAAGVHSEAVTPEVNGASVTMRAPGAGWVLAATPERSVTISVTYRAPLLPAEVDGGGVTFDVAGREEGLGWTDMGGRLIVGLPTSVDPIGSSAMVFGS